MAGFVEDIKVIVHENEKRTFFLDGIGSVNEVVATVGVKIQTNGEQYGNYVVFKKATVTVPEVVEAVNLLLYEILVNMPKEVKQNDSP